MSALSTETSGAIRISLELRDELIRHALAERPNEACGFLGGRDGVVERFFPIRNRAKSPVRYEMDPRDQLRAEDEIERDGLEIVGVFHSHPDTPAFPSPTDCTRAYWPARDPTTGGHSLIYPGAVYVIASLRDADAPEIRAFRMVEEVSVE